MLGNSRLSRPVYDNTTPGDVTDGCARPARLPRPASFQPDSVPIKDRSRIVGMVRAGAARVTSPTAP